MENVPATSRSSPKKQVGSIRATCRDCESEEGPQWTEERKHFVREEAVRSESIARKQVDTANAGMDQREYQSVDREEAGRYGEREAWIRERIGATGRVRSEPIARKHVREAARIVGSEGHT